MKNPICEVFCEAQRNKKAEEVYVTATHSAQTLQTMTQRVRQEEERGASREADGGQDTERRMCDSH